jgi:ABC-type nitrate/sulfonate/bicarbonate transport system ATPase subunit
VSKLSVHGLHKAYCVNGRVVLQALAGVDLAAQAGEFVTLIGPSGCGKSTLFNLICGLQRPDAGQVCLDGQDVTYRTGRVGYMPQRDLLLPWRSVLDNVILGLEVAGVPRHQARAEAHELLPLFGLAGFEDSFPATLSGGMKQRAALLRTFLCRRDVMLLDEPFGALDALTRADLQTWLLEVWDHFRQTILFITHDVTEAVYLSDRVYVMTPRPGRIQAELGINLPRPRQRSVVTTPEFLALEARLLDWLEQGK